MVAVVACAVAATMMVLRPPRVLARLLALPNLCAALTLRWVSGGWSAPNRFLLIAFSSLAFWEVSAVGSDFPTFGVVLVILLCLLDRWRDRLALLLALALMLGIVATARVVFLFVPILFGFLVWQHNRRAGVILAAIAATVAVALHVGFWLWDAALYTLVHVIGLADQVTPLAIKLAGVVATGSAGVALCFARGPSLERWFALLWLSLAAPLAFVALGDLIVCGHGDPAAWEGANYMIISLPLPAAWVALRSS